MHIYIHIPIYININIYIYIQTIYIQNIQTMAKQNIHGTTNTPNQILGYVDNMGSGL